MDNTTIVRKPVTVGSIEFKHYLDLIGIKDSFVISVEEEKEESWAECFGVLVLILVFSPLIVLLLAYWAPFLIFLPCCLVGCLHRIIYGKAWSRKHGTIANPYYGQDFNSVNKISKLYIEDEEFRIYFDLNRERVQEQRFPRNEFQENVNRSLFHRHTLL